MAGVNIRAALLSVMVLYKILLLDASSIVSKRLNDYNQRLHTNTTHEGTDKISSDANQHANVLFSPVPVETYPRVLYQIENFTQKLDHFNFDNHMTFPMRYIVNAEYWGGSGYPVIFYCGNEGPIEAFYENAGFVTDVVASFFKAYVVFAEHRYFGKSFPSFGTQHEGLYYPHLTVEQVLEDYSSLLFHLQKTRLGLYTDSDTDSQTRDLLDAPVIAVGGSYGGMLAAWLRMKYPSVVVGALAASAPVLQYFTDEYAFAQKVSENYNKCREMLQIIFNKMNTLSGEEIEKDLNTCETALSEQDMKTLSQWLMDALTDVAMTNYPTDSDFLGPRPAWPVDRFCQVLNAGDGGRRQINLLQHLKYRNFNSGPVPKAADKTKTKTRTDTQTNVKIKTLRDALQSVGIVKPNECLDFQKDTEATLKADAWEYFTCTTQIFPFSSNGKSDIFPPQRFNPRVLKETCERKYNVRIDLDWAQRYLGNTWATCSNIIFSNGDMDPWSTGGFRHAPTPECPCVWISGGAHHVDLRLPSVNDTASTQAARKQEILTMSLWIQEFYKSQQRAYDGHLQSDNVQKVEVI